MSKVILLSIHPKWAKLIYEGKKTIEWRKTIPCKLSCEELNKDSENVYVYLYETHPVKKITGCFKFGGVKILDARPMKEDALGCVPIEELKKYQGENCNLCAWIIKTPYKFSESLSLSLADINLKRPPRSWQYVEVNE